MERMALAAIWSGAAASTGMSARIASHIAPQAKSTGSLPAGARTRPAWPWSAAIEQAYYDENDLAKRDTEIVKKFNDVKAKLDATRADAPPKP